MSGYRVPAAKEFWEENTDISLDLTTLNPQIPRRLAEDKQPITDWQFARFQIDYNPYNNPWMV